MDEYKFDDERIIAWEQIARHPFFAKDVDCETNEPLIELFLERLDAQTTKPVMEETRAELPVEYRILRAFTNGFTEGLQRGTNGRLDH